MGSEEQFQQTSKNWKRIDMILSIIQMTCFSASFIILMYFTISTTSQSDPYLCSYKQVSLVAVAIFIKLVRMVPIKNVPRKIALSQIKFYTPYLLTIMQCVFKYFSQPHQHATEISINLYLIFLITKNIYYSFLTHEKLTSFIEAIVASLTLVAWVTLGVYSLMTSVYQFDNQVENDYKKDLILLFLTTLIGNGGMMMDLIFRPVEEMIKEKEEEEEEKQNQEYQHLHKKAKDCPHCHKELTQHPSHNQSKRQKPITHHEHTNLRSQTQSPFYPGTSNQYRESNIQPYRKTAMNQPNKAENKKYQGLSINEQFSGTNSKNKSINMNDTGRDIELNLMDKQEEPMPRKSKIY